MRLSLGYRALVRLRYAATGLLAVVLSAGPVQAQKTDVLILGNGDHVTGEIKEFTRGMVRFSTDPMGTVYVKWEDIVSVTSDKTFEIELQSGQKFFGSIRPSEMDGQDEIVTGEAAVPVRHLSVVRVTPIKDTFWSRLSGSIDLGLSFLQQNTQFDYNLSTDMEYRAANSTTKLDISSIVRLQNEAETTNRQQVSLIHVQSFAPKWIWAALGAFDKNAELSLAGRGSAGGGAGRIFIQTNKVTLGTWGGLVYAHEQFEEQPADNVLNGIVSTIFDFFIVRGRKSDITVNLDLIPSLTQGGRIRIESNAEGRHEFFKDFFFKLKIFNSFDSKPPTEGTTRKNDFGLTTSVGWSFG